MLQIHCKMCTQPFGPLGERSQPRVIPCGHSFCESCLNVWTSPEIVDFQCPSCFTRHEVIHVRFPPVNHLYYEMLTEFNEFIKRKDWEQGNPKQEQEQEKEDEPQAQINIEFKCLYPFCHRQRYEKDGVKEVFCSAKCMELNGELYT